MNSDQTPFAHPACIEQDEQIENPITGASAAEKPTFENVTHDVDSAVNFGKHIDDNESMKGLGRISWGALFFPAIWALKYRIWKWAGLFLALIAISLAAGITNHVLVEQSSAMFDRWIEVSDARWALDPSDSQWQSDWDALAAEQDALWKQIEAFHFPIMIVSYFALIIGGIYFVASILFALRANRTAWNVRRNLNHSSQTFSQNQKMWVFAWIAWQALLLLSMVLALNFFISLPWWASSTIFHLSATPISISSLYGTASSIWWAISEGIEVGTFQLISVILAFFVYGCYLTLYLRDRKQKKFWESK